MFKAVCNCMRWIHTAKEFSMWINGINYRLTKHGRKRYLERVNPNATDAEILRHCVEGVNGYRVVWEPEKGGDGFRLVTIVENNE